jgi:hypothetical protein
MINKAPDHVITGYNMECLMGSNINITTAPCGSQILQAPTVAWTYSLSIDNLQFLNIVTDKQLYG